MRLRSRLQRLEREAATSGRAEEDQPDPWDDTERRTAYLRGEGPCPPHPPCPPCLDPVTWASGHRMFRCLGARISGELPDKEYLADMDARERSHIDETFAVLAAIAEEQMELEADQETERPGDDW